MTVGVVSTPPALAGLLLFTDENTGTEEDTSHCCCCCPLTGATATDRFELGSADVMMMIDKIHKPRWVRVCLLFCKRCDARLNLDQNFVSSTRTGKGIFLRTQNGRRGYVKQK